MISSRTAAFLVVTLGAAFAWSCGPRQVTPAPERPGQSLVVLLPDPDSGVTGRANVSNPAGSTDLAGPRSSTTASTTGAPSPAMPLSEAEVQRLFGAALSSLPPAPRHFTLYFRFDSDELTDESRALFPMILQSVAEQAVPEVLVIGHTDTTGTAPSNVELGLKRANTVRNLLVEARLNPALIEVTSHGEADLLIPTANDVAEPRNRRVEITIR
jgi:outer membrane protein OmpA-like peptidoglycan-associated protein